MPASTKSRSIYGNLEFLFLHHLSPILGIAIMKIPAETLKLRTILFKLFLMVAKSVSFCFGH
jgi:hypothetical protein